MKVPTGGSEQGGPEEMRSKKNRERARELGLDIDDIRGFEDFDDLKAQVDPDPVEEFLSGGDESVPEEGAPAEQIDDIYSAPRNEEPVGEYEDEYDDEYDDDEYDDEEYDDEDDEDYDEEDLDDEDKPRHRVGKIIIVVALLALLGLVGYRVYDHFIADGGAAENSAVTVKVAVASEGEIKVSLNWLGKRQRGAGHCPRCGKPLDTFERHALSRRANITICDDCGLREALEDAGFVPRLPLSDWWCVKNNWVV